MTVATTASAVTSTLVSVLSNVNESSNWNPLPPEVMGINVTWSPVVAVTVATAPKPTRSAPSSLFIIPSDEESEV